MRLNGLKRTQDREQRKKQQHPQCNMSGQQIILPLWAAGRKCELKAAVISVAKCNNVRQEVTGLAASSNEALMFDHLLNRVRVESLFWSQNEVSVSVAGLSEFTSQTLSEALNPEWLATAVFWLDDVVILWSCWRHYVAMLTLLATRLRLLDTIFRTASY